MVPSPRRLPHTISLLEGAGFEPSVPRGHVEDAPRNFDVVHRGWHTRYKSINSSRRSPARRRRSSEVLRVSGATRGYRGWRSSPALRACRATTSPWPVPPLRRPPGGWALAAYADTLINRSLLSG